MIAGTFPADPQPVNTGPVNSGLTAIAVRPDKGMIPGLNARRAKLCAMRGYTTMAASTRPRPAAPPPDDVLVLEDFLPYRLAVLATIVSHGFARLYSERFGVSIPEWRVIAMLGQHGTLTSKEIGEQTHMHKTMVSRAVTDLDRHGMLSRLPNRADKREVFLSLTDNGRRIYAEIVPLARDYAARLTADLSRSDRATFDRIIATLRDRSDVVFAPERKEPNG